jgi:hypothetical protein
MMSGGGTVMKWEAKHNFDVYRVCNRCEHEELDEDEEPCNDCFDIVGHPNWKAKDCQDCTTQHDSVDACYDCKSNIDHPTHYNTGKIETIVYIEDNLTKEQYEGFLQGNIIKYISRFRHKNGLEDLEKTKWYLEKLIESWQKGREIDVT